MKAFRTMYKTEFKLGMREADVPMFAFIFPVVIALVLGAIYGVKDTQALGKTFASSSTIGLAAMGLMGLPLTLSGYRDAKILKQLQATPVKSSLVLLAQFAVKLTLAMLSAVLVWGALAICFGYRMTANPFIYLIAYILVAFGIFGIGMIIASVSKDAAMTGMLCSIVYFPMLLFSGTTIPLDIFPQGVVKFLQVLPLTQGINLLETVALGGSIFENLIATIAMFMIGIVAIVISIMTFKWE